VFYRLLKIYARCAIRVYCREVFVNEKAWLGAKGPILLASNHPASFLDGIIYTTLFNSPVYSLARGDAFRKGWANRLLRRLKLLPVYRTSEGIDNLGYNYETFTACHEVFKEGGIVLIFSEAGSINEWALRPLRKGTARLAISSWQQGLAVKVLPAGINYNRFKKWGKEVHIHFAKPITQADINPNDSSGRQLAYFTAQLTKALEPLVYTAADKGAASAYFKKQDRKFRSWLLLVPAGAGWLLHAPLFYTVWLFTRMFFNESDHYDAVMVALLLLLYPVYLLVITLLLPLPFYIAALSFLVLPFTAWAWLQCRIRL
jgi:1-acyl-sn-glycerol-3-phosphate acyltransferase